MGFWDVFIYLGRGICTIFDYLGTENDEEMLDGTLAIGTFAAATCAFAVLRNKNDEQIDANLICWQAASVLSLLSAVASSRNRVG
ncbi:hypothetical protein I5L01_16095, partial [Erythrobacter sp. YJ-T3-07]|uniref:hypothetical protein n=1 Tax=Erythrobacter sp. YJ-T3-07 TaxID=2793063 RepID=UPI0018D4995A